jgi:hypothetical protein
MTTPAQRPLVGAPRIYSHGYIMVAFGYLEGREFFMALLKSDIETYEIPPSSTVPWLPQPCSFIQGSRALDYTIDQFRGLVVPQTSWRPLSERNRLRYFVQDRLELPIFFVHEDGTIGVTLADALSGTVRPFVDFSTQRPWESKQPNILL